MILCRGCKQNVMGSSMVTGYTVGVYFKMLSEHDAKAAKKRPFRTT